MYNIKLSFELKENFLPREIERVAVSFLKAAALREGQDFFGAMFDKGRSISKAFCFSYYLPQPQFQEDKIILRSSNFSIFFSDANLEELLRFYNGFLKLKFEEYPIKGNIMELKSVFLNKMKEIQDDTIVIKMLSPLLVRSHDVATNKDKYYLFSEIGFSEALKKNIEVQLRRLGKSFPMENFSITPIKAKKVVVPNFGQKLDGNLGVFKLTGNPDLLNFLYQAGMGSRRNEGRGKWEIFF